MKTLLLTITILLSISSTAQLADTTNYDYVDLHIDPHQEVKDIRRMGFAVAFVSATVYYGGMKMDQRWIMCLGFGMSLVSFPIFIHAENVKRKEILFE